MATDNGIDNINPFYIHTKSASVCGQTVYGQNLVMKCVNDMFC